MLKVFCKVAEPAQRASWSCRTQTGLSRIIEARCGEGFARVNPVTPIIARLGFNHAHNQLPGASQIRYTT